MQIMESLQLQYFTRNFVAIAFSCYVLCWPTGQIVF